MTGVPQIEEDFPKGHPGRADYDPNSADAKEWVRQNVAPLGERDFPAGHPKAADTPGNQNRVEWSAGADPYNPQREPFTGRTPEQAAGVALMSQIASAAAKESPVLQPLDALEVASAMNAKRKELGRDILTPEEYSAVLATLQTRPRSAEDPEETKRKISEQHQALTVLLGKGYDRQTALNMIAMEGAAAILKRFPAE